MPFEDEESEYYERSVNGAGLQKFGNREGFDPIERESHVYSGDDWVHGMGKNGPTLVYVGPTTGYYMPPPWSTLESFDSHSDADETSSVYLIHSRATKRVKIGQSKQVYKRFSAIRAMSGSDVELVAVLPNEDEYHLHKRFADRRLVGEWFDESVLDDLRADGTIE